MSLDPGGWLPPHAHVPGANRRHDEGLFDAFRTTVRPGMSAATLAQSPAFRAGLRFHRAGYHWEAHEVWEAVWMACPDDSAERALVQGLIQIANARLKIAMGKPKASVRLCGIAAECLRQSAERAGASGLVLGVDLEALRREIAAIEKTVNAIVQNNAK